ncbi:hypothetical protein EJ110_NYTH10996 [Nymphaea thermarum]|nr:hypothetical protein EJ110_NYTH10996 [Nymphaea thermarum]
MVVEDEEVRYPICLEGFGTDMEASKTSGRHRYHKDHINKWLENHSTCPVCSFQMPPVEENNPAAGGAAQREGEGERRERRAEEQERLNMGISLHDIEALQPWDRRRVSDEEGCSHSAILGLGGIWCDVDGVEFSYCTSHASTSREQAYMELVAGLRGSDTQIGHGSQILYHLLKI